ncbi:MAG TPA: hypothetical protein PKH07_05095, partial [bacterium]|nr:hypothetical protein [bacterium]
MLLEQGFLSLFTRSSGSVAEGLSVEPSRSAEAETFSPEFAALLLKLLGQSQNGIQQGNLNLVQLITHEPSNQTSFPSLDSSNQSQGVVRSTAHTELFLEQRPPMVQKPSANLAQYPSEIFTEDPNSVVSVFIPLRSSPPVTVQQGREHVRGILVRMNQTPQKTDVNKNDPSPRQLKILGEVLIPVEDLHRVLPLGDTVISEKDTDKPESTETDSNTKTVHHEHRLSLESDRSYRQEIDAGLERADRASTSNLQIGLTASSNISARDPLEILTIELREIQHDAIIVSNLEIQSADTLMGMLSGRDDLAEHPEARIAPKPALRVRAENSTGEDKTPDRIQIPYAPRVAGDATTATVTALKADTGADTQTKTDAKPAIFLESTSRVEAFQTPDQNATEQATPRVLVSEGVLTDEASSAHNFSHATAEPVTDIRSVNQQEMLDFLALLRNLNATRLEVFVAPEHQEASPCLKTTLVSDSKAAAENGTLLEPTAVKSTPRQQAAPSPIEIKSSIESRPHETQNQQVENARPDSRTTTDVPALRSMNAPTQTIAVHLQPTTPTV